MSCFFGNTFIWYCNYPKQVALVRKLFTRCYLSLVYSKKDIAKSHFVRYLWKSIVDRQALEIERALTNESAEYCLSRKAQYLAIPTEVWYQWTYEDRMKYIKFVRSLGKTDIENQKAIDTINWENKDSDLPLAKQNLSVKLSESLRKVLLAETIEKKAINPLNHLTALVLSPTTQITAQKENSF